MQNIYQSILNMKNVKSMIGSLKTSELVIIVLIIVYLVFPLQTPQLLIPFIETPLGIALIVGATIAMFFYTNPLLAVLFIFFAYTLLRRSSNNVSLLSQLNKISTQSVMGVPSKLSSDPAKVETEMNPILQDSHVKEITEQTMKSDEMSYPMTYEQSMDNIHRVALIERDLSEGTYTREEQSILNDQSVVTHPPVSLEEEVVKERAPIDRPIASVITHTQFQPISSKTGSYAPY